MMTTPYETKQIKLNSDLRGKNKGDVIPIKVDKSGVPKERYWRDRLRDSKYDNCIEFVNKTVNEKNNNGVINDN